MSAADFIPPGFTLGERLGSGQTAVVWLADHHSFGRVALKLPRAEVHVQPVLRRMFENEVQITLSLRHPNLVAGLAGHPTGPGAYLALEHCAGGPLEPAGVTQAATAISYILDVAAGLEASHAHQVLHRDVKPNNVFLTGDGSAKLGDFGTGCYMTDENPDRVGTAFYMAPEIFEGKPATPASDIYSLGILAYELLTGVRPFSGDTYEQLLHAHTSTLPRPMHAHVPELPREIAAVVGRAMSREAGRRQPTVTKFREELEAASGEKRHPTIIETGRATRQPAADGDGEAGARKRRGLFAWLRRRG
ncbi:MAG TPA: serine/threonine-protein kinase [Deinococcales bacterium]|nr:serine/threonine-protein kinase [Deinococcales bacterium]